MNTIMMAILVLLFVEVTLGIVACVRLTSRVDDIENGKSAKEAHDHKESKTNMFSRLMGFPDEFDDEPEDDEEEIEPEPKVVEKEVRDKIHDAMYEMYYGKFATDLSKFKFNSIDEFMTYVTEHKLMLFDTIDKKFRVIKYLDPDGTGSVNITFHDGTTSKFSLYRYAKAEYIKEEQYERNTRQAAI